MSLKNLNYVKFIVYLKKIERKKKTKTRREGLYGLFETARYLHHLAALAGSLFGHLFFQFTCYLGKYVSNIVSHNINIYI